jgi:hypothetical protein
VHICKCTIVALFYTTAVGTGAEDSDNAYDDYDEGKEDRDVRKYFREREENQLMEDSEPEREQ